MIDWTYTSIPVGVREALDNWAQHGWEPGGFTRSVLLNDLSGAIGRADHASMAALPTIAAYVYNELPSPCWGSVEKMAAWAKRFEAAKEGSAG